MTKENIRNIYMHNTYNHIYIYIPHVDIEEYLGLEGGPPFSRKIDQNLNTPFLNEVWYLSV